MAVQCKIFGHQWRIKQRSNVIQFEDIYSYDEDDDEESENP